MAKQTLSVTLEPQTIENIRKMAADELRTVSSMIEYIVAEYMQALQNTLTCGCLFLPTDSCYP